MILMALVALVGLMGCTTGAKKGGCKDGACDLSAEKNSKTQDVPGADAPK